MRQILFSAAKVLITATLLYLSLRKVDFVELAGRINGASVGWLALAIALTILQIAISAYRWELIGESCRAPLRFARALRFNFIGSFFNQTLPSSIGGDAMRIWLVARSGAGWRAATYSVFVDRAIGMIALTVVILLAMPWSLDLIQGSEGRVGLMLLESGALGACLGFLLLHVVRFDLVTRVWPTRHFFECSRIAFRILTASRTEPMIIAASLSIHVLAVAVAWSVARAIAAPADFWQLLQLVPAVMLITVIPISIAGWGLREASMGLAFGYAGIGASEGVNVSLLFGAVYFVVGAIGGLIWIVSAEKAAKGDAPIEVPE